MKNLYKWQRTIIWFIGILTFVSVTIMDFGKEFNVGYFVDLIIGVSLNVLILFAIFKIGNWIYKTVIKR